MPLGGLEEGSLLMNTDNPYMLLKVKATKKKRKIYTPLFNPVHLG